MQPTSLYAQTVKLVPQGVVPGDRFGWSIILDGDDLVVGAAFDDIDVVGGSALDAGSAYAFERQRLDPLAWRQTAYLIDDLPEPIDEFGFAVDIEGDTLAIGVEDDDATRGGVMIFERQPGGIWQPAFKIQLEDALIEDSLGVSLDLEGDFLVVGTVRGILRDEPPGGVNLPGIAHVFHRHQGGLDQWGQVTQLEASDGQPGDAFGHSVTLAGDLIAVGAPGSVGRGDEGAVYLFRRHAGGENAWGQVQKLQPQDVGPGDTFGWSVELAPDASSLFVGSPRHDQGGVDSGAAYLFDHLQGSFVETQKLRSSVIRENDLFGFSLSLEDRLLAIGSIFGEDTGVVDLFSGDGTWQPLARVRPEDGGFGDQFGFSVDLDGGTLGVGAPYHQSVGAESGATYLFRLDEVLPDRCVPGDRIVHCLQDQRFRVEISWQDFVGDTGLGKTVPFQTDVSGLFWFFQPDNWEIQVKVIDGCDFNQRFWVFAAATTDVAYTLKVTDTLTGIDRMYENGLGMPAPATTDTDAFATCP